MREKEEEEEKGDIQVKQEVQVAKACGDGSSKIVVWHGAGEVVLARVTKEGRRRVGRTNREEANKDEKRGDIQVLDCLEVAQVLRELSRDGVVVQDTADVVSTEI